MEPSFRVLGISKQTPHPKIATPHGLKLSFLDLPWYKTPPTECLLFYNTETHFPTLVNKLKEALSLALHHFYPLAGKFIWSPESDELEIRCGAEDDGVLFIEAETDSDFQRLVNDGMHDVAMYKKLVSPLDILELPMPVMSVQVTRFVAGGVSIGITRHHMAMDGNALWHFMKSWAEICKSGDLLLRPSHDRSVIRDTEGASKVIFDFLRPRLPKITHTSSSEPAQTMRRTFLLGSADVQLLKEKAEKQQTEPSSGPVSTFVAVAAHSWVCSVRARKIDEKENTTFIFTMDCRPHLDPPIVQGYFGNCLIGCRVQAMVCELLGETGFGLSVSRIRRSIKENRREPLKDVKSWFKRWISESLEVLTRTITNIASSPRLRVYETDFGWGRPSRVESVSMNNEGFIALDQNRDEEGGIQLSIALAPPHMDEFGVLFFEGLQGNK